MLALTPLAPRAVVTLAREGSFDAASTSSMGVMKVLRLTKIFRLIKLARFANDEAASWLPPSVTMLSKLGFVFLLVIHLVACLYWGVASQYFAELAMRCQREEEYLKRGGRHTEAHLRHLESRSW